MSTVEQFKEIHVNQNNKILIAADETASTIFDCGGTTLCAIKVDSNLSEKTLTFNVEINSVSGMWPLYTPYIPTTQVSLEIPTIAANNYVVIWLQPQILAGIRYLQIVSNSAVAASSFIELWTRPV